MSLSDKIETVLGIDQETWEQYGTEEAVKQNDVKEFIKDLKECLEDNVSCLNMAEEKNMLDIVDKLAGNKLI